MRDVVIDSAGLVNFHKLVVLAGTVEGARPLFEQLVNDVVEIAHPEVRSITASPGDWGIDAFVGDLDGGKVGVWQAKFYLDKTDVPQQGDIRNSYDSAVKAATDHGYTLSTWTLAVPSEMTPKMAQWWDGWKKRMESRDKVAFELWDFGRLRRRLMAEEAREKREYWFGPHGAISAAQSGAPGEQIPWQDVADEQHYDDFLFVHQLAQANMTETRSAREAFFNAEILEAEIADKGVARETGALRAWRARIGSVWETKFNSISSNTAGKQLPGLYDAVMTDIDHNHGELATALRAQTLHGQGLMHQQVETAHAGWVRNWREIADAHGAHDTVGSTSTAANRDVDAAPGVSPVVAALPAQPVPASAGRDSADGAASGTAAATSREGGGQK